MAIVVRMNGQVIEVDSVAELSWLGCMIDGNATDKGNGNGATHGVVKGLLGYRKEYGSEATEELKKWLAQQHGAGTSRNTTVQDALDTYGVEVNSSTAYRLWIDGYAQ